MRPVTISEAEPFLFERGSVGALLIHGFTSTPFEVRELGECLADAGLTVLGPVLPGHRTTPDDLASTCWRDWFDATQAGLARLKTLADEVFIMGSSAGAALALHAAAHDSSLSGVVALGTLIRIRGVNPRWLRLVAHLRPFQPKRGGSSISDPVARARHPSYDCLPLKAVASLAEFLNHLRDDLPEVRVPVLMIHARHDSVAAPADVALILDRLGSRHKSAIWIENSDHIITEDYGKEEVFEHAVRFVQKHSVHRRIESRD
jgi:carboxylesterase